MNLFRNLLQGAAGGLLAGATLGVIEATWLLATTGAPDLLSPFYAAVLYGLLGFGLGLGAGVLLSLIERFKRLGTNGESVAFAFGTAGAVVPMGVFILFYVVNKVVYAEAGIPLVGKLAILGAAGLYTLIALKFGSRWLRGGLKFLRKGPVALGSWAALVAVLFGVSFIPVGEDVRANWAHHKPIPDALKSVPNVLFIAVDTLRADALGTYGAPGNPTPVIDALANDGVVFEKHFAQASWTRASFASIFSSRIASSHNTATKAAMLPDDVQLLSEVLHDGGVTTGNLANNINVTQTFNFDQGYDSFLYESPSYPFGATESVFGLTFYKVVIKVRERLFGAHKEVTDFYQPADVVLADAKSFITANKDSRWYLGVHLMEPHDPYFEHPYLEGKGDAKYNGVGFARAEVEKPDVAQADHLKKLYADEVRHLDLELAPFVAWLKAQGLYDDTMIVITADHGEEFAEHGGFWHGTTLYDEQTHTPLILKMPKQALSTTRVVWQTRSIDIAPSITGMLGLKPSPQWEGHDVLADAQTEVEQVYLRARALADQKRFVEEHQLQIDDGTADEATIAAVEQAKAAIVLAEAPVDPCAAYRKPLDRLVVGEEDFEGNVLSSIRTEGFKCIQANAGNPRGLAEQELYDVIADGKETKNLVGGTGAVCGRPIEALPKDICGLLADALKAGASHKSESGGNATLSQDEKCKLCALGYMSGPDCDGCN